MRLQMHIWVRFSCLNRAKIVATCCRHDGWIRFSFGFVSSWRGDLLLTGSRTPAHEVREPRTGVPQWPHPKPLAPTATKPRLEASGRFCRNSSRAFHATGAASPPAALTAFFAAPALPIQPVLSSSPLYRDYAFMSREIVFYFCPPPRHPPAHETPGSGRTGIERPD